MRCLVTGGAGFIGSHVAEALVRRGCFTRVLDNFSTGKRENLVFLRDVPGDRHEVVELLGPLGYSREHLAEKWMRDAKINDIFEGTQQINMMIIARRILGYSGKELS